MEAHSNVGGECIIQQMCGMFCNHGKPFGWFHSHTKDAQHLSSLSFYKFQIYQFIWHFIILYICLENAKHFMFSLKMVIFPKSTSWKSYVPIVANCKDFYVSQCLETYEVFQKDTKFIWTLLTYGLHLQSCAHNFGEILIHLVQMISNLQGAL